MVPSAGTGRFATAAGSGDVVGSGPLLTYRVQVEDGLPFDAAGFAAAVDATLADKRGWVSRGRSFKRDHRAATRVVLASPETTDRLCAPLQTDGQVSCRNGNDVVINAVRWAEGAESYGDDLATYRIYLINHEVGHRLGLGHQPCPGNARPAPVMHQQTLGLNGCTANPWP